MPIGEGAGGDIDVEGTDPFPAVAPVAPIRIGLILCIGVGVGV